MYVASADVNSALCALVIDVTCQLREVRSTPSHLRADWIVCAEMSTRAFGIQSWLRAVQSGLLQVARPSLDCNHLSPNGQYRR